MTAVYGPLNQKLYIALSLPEHSPEGEILGSMYYSGFIGAVLNRREHTGGYPHNGGSHFIHLSLTKVESDAFLDLIKDHFRKDPDLQEFVKVYEAAVKKAAESSFFVRYTY